MTLAGVGLTGCRRPEAYLVLFNKGVEWTVPGKFLITRRRCLLRQGAMPLVVSTVDGRPTKIEGNPLHPWSNGGTDAFAQAKRTGSLRSEPFEGDQGKRRAKCESDAFEKFLKSLADSGAENSGISCRAQELADT